MVVFGTPLSVNIQGKQKSFARRRAASAEANAERCFVCCVTLGGHTKASHVTQDIEFTSQKSDPHSHALWTKSVTRLTTHFHVGRMWATHVGS